MEMGKAEMCRNEWGAACDDTMNLVFDKLGLKCFEDIQIKDAQQAFKTMPANPRREYWLWYRYRCRDAELTHPGRLHSFLSLSMVHSPLFSVSLGQRWECNPWPAICKASAHPLSSTHRPPGEEWMGQGHRWNHHESQHVCREPGHRRPTPDWCRWSGSQEWGHPGKSHIVEARYQKVKLRKICWNLLSKM